MRGRQGALECARGPLEPLGAADHSVATAGMDEFDTHPIGRLAAHGAARMRLAVRSRPVQDAGDMKDVPACELVPLTHTNGVHAYDTGFLDCHRRFYQVSASLGARVNAYKNGTK